MEPVMLPYHRAQAALAELKAAVYLLLDDAPLGGLTDAQVGRSLGIHDLGSDGRLTAALLAMMEAEGVVEHDPETDCWRLRSHVSEADAFQG
jgi:hypothetical protein